MKTILLTLMVAFSTISYGQVYKLTQLGYENADAWVYDTVGVSKFRVIFYHQALIITNGSTTFTFFANKDINPNVYENYTGASQLNHRRVLTVISCNDHIKLRISDYMGSSVFWVGEKDVNSGYFLSIFN